jgi:glutamate racemase
MDFSPIPAQPTIGVFDSGVGGLTTLRSIQARFPWANTVYLGDTARVPYGSKSAATVQRYSINVARRIEDLGCHMLVIACNTASAHAVDAVKAAIRIPVIDVISPLATTLATTTPKHPLTVGVLATRGTVASNAYPRAIHASLPEAVVIQQPCPLFVPLAEEGWISGPVPAAVARTYLEALQQRGRPDALVLGCTHYPLLRDVIVSSMAELGWTARVYDSGEPTADAMAKLLTSPHSETTGFRRYLVTDDAASFIAVAERFLGAPVVDVEHVDIGTDCAAP